MAVAPANAVEVIVRGWMAAVMEMLSVVLAVRAGEPASVTVKVMGKLPVVVGVPEMMPLLRRLSPTGSAVEDQV